MQPHLFHNESSLVEQLSDTEKEYVEERWCQHTTLLDACANSKGSRLFSSHDHRGIHSIMKLPEDVYKFVWAASLKEDVP